MKKYLPKIIIGAIILIVVVFVVRALMAPESTNDTTSQVSSSELEALKAGQTKGNTESSVVVTEFADFQCPACAAWQPFIKNTIIPQYQGKILFVFKNFPLPIHKNANAAAYAAQAAALQGKFWEMYDLLYENQKEWENEKDPSGKFQDYARRLDLDIDKFNSDRGSQAVKNVIADDVALGEKLKVPGTPTFFVNGVIVETNSEADLVKAIEAAIAASQPAATPAPTPAPAQ